jgi:hypothetical protein
MNNLFKLSSCKALSETSCISRHKKATSLLPFTEQISKDYIIYAVGIQTSNCQLVEESAGVL